MQLAWHRRVLAVVMTAPALVAALSIVALEVWRIYRPDSELFVTPFAYTLADAIERDDVRRAYAFIRAGQDPNELIAVRHPVLTAGRGALVSPLLWSVATNSGNSMRMLLGHGARMERRADRAAACLADALGHNDVARLLRQVRAGARRLSPVGGHRRATGVIPVRDQRRPLATSHDRRRRPAMSQQ